MMVADSNEIEDSQVSPQAAARLVSAARLRARQADFDDAVDELMVLLLLLLLLFDDLKVERPDCGNMRSGMVCSQLHGERTLVSVACLAVASLTRKLKLWYKVQSATYDTTAIVSSGEGEGGDKR